MYCSGDKVVSWVEESGYISTEEEFCPTITVALKYSSCLHNATGLNYFVDHNSICKPHLSLRFLVVVSCAKPLWISVEWLSVCNQEEVSIALFLLLS